MHKGVGDVQLINWPLLVNGARLDHWREGIAEINSSTLGNPAHHPPCLVLLKAAVGLEFALGGWGTRVQVLFTVRASNSDCIAKLDRQGLRHWGERCGGRSSQHGILLVQYKGTSLGSGHHVMRRQWSFGGANRCWSRSRRGDRITY
jgi:hypothetical protein